MSPTPAVINSALRRMKALIIISPSSASVCTKASICRRSSSITLPGLVARKRNMVRRPDSVPTSPVNWPEQCTGNESLNGSRRAQNLGSQLETTTKNDAGSYLPGRREFRHALWSVCVRVV